MDRLLRQLDLSSRSTGRVNKHPFYQPPPPPQVQPPSTFSREDVQTMYEIAYALRQKREAEALLATRGVTQYPPPMTQAVNMKPRSSVVPSANVPGVRNLANVPGLICVFCRNNGETEQVYTNHQLKDKLGRVTCPILRAYSCPTCGANGDTAHTLKYCPMGYTGKSTSSTAASIPRSLMTTRRYLAV